MNGLAILRTHTDGGYGLAPRRRTDPNGTSHSYVRESTDLKVCGYAAADVLREARPLRPEAKFIRRHAGLIFGLTCECPSKSVEVRAGTRRSSLN